MFSCTFCCVNFSNLRIIILKYFSLNSSVSSKSGANGIRIALSHPSGAVPLSVLDGKLA